MKRHRTVALIAAVALAAGVSNPTSVAGARTPARPLASARTSTGIRTAALDAPRGRSVITARRRCHWRRYRDGAIGTDPKCAPGELDPAVIRLGIRRTICNRSWLAAARFHASTVTKTKLYIEYGAYGNPITYRVAHVIPIEDGGSRTSSKNLYLLPFLGYGGQETQTAVATKLHRRLCAREITLAKAAKTLAGDWLSVKLRPD